MDKIKFSVWANVNLAYQGAWKTVRHMGSYSVILIAMWIALDIVYSILFYEKHSLSISSSNVYVKQLSEIIFGIFSALLTAPFAIAIHRYVLLSEIPATPYLGIIFSRRSLRFTLYGMLIWHAVFTIPQALIDLAIHSNLGALVFASFTLPWITMIVAPRLFLVLPAIAINANKYGIRTLWKISKHNTGRLFLALVLMSPLPFIRRLSERIVIPNFENDILFILSYEILFLLAALFQVVVMVRGLSLMFQSFARYYSK